MRSLCAAAAAAVVLSGCVDTEERDSLRNQVEELESRLDLVSREATSLRIERDGLKRQVEALSLTAPAIYSDLSRSIKSGNLEDSKGKLALLRERFPLSKEQAQAEKDVAGLEDSIKKQEEQRKRLASLGFMGLPAPGVVDGSEIRVTLGQPSNGKLFVFDRYDDTYHYIDADRDHRYLVMTMSVSAKKGVGNPDLFGFAAYVAEGQHLKRLGDFDVQFSRWSSYATYLGNYSDSRNDFAKTAQINFNIGLQVSDEDLKKKPIYVVASTAGCLTRGYDRFGSPPDSYSGHCPALREKLELEDFTGDAPSVVMVRRFG